MKTAIALAAAALLTSCMSDNRYKLSKDDLAIKAKHSETYIPFTLKGPLTLDKDSSIEVRVPARPFQPTEY